MRVVPVRMPVAQGLTQEVPVRMPVVRGRMQVVRGRMRVVRGHTPGLHQLLNRSNSQRCLRQGAQ